MQPIRTYLCTPQIWYACLTVYATVYCSGLVATTLFLPNDQPDP